MDEITGPQDGLWKTARWARDEGYDALEVIVHGVASGKTLKAICKEKGWPKSIVSKWIAEDQERKAQYDSALSLWADELAQDTVEIADDDKAEVGRSKLRVDTRMRLASRWDRARYGENPNVNITAQAGSLISILSSLPPVKAPEEIEVKDDDVR